MILTIILIISNIINGKTYKFDPNLTHNVAILPNGDIINGDGLNDKDKKLLDLMKLRDSAKDEEKRYRYQLSIWELWDDGNDTVIEVNQPYGYYTLTEDVTYKLNKFMKQAVKECEYVKRMDTIPGLIEFKDLVKAGVVTINVYI